MCGCAAHASTICSRTVNDHKPVTSRQVWDPQSRHCDRRRHRFHIIRVTAVLEMPHLVLERQSRVVLVATGAAAAEEPKEIEEDLDDLI